MKWLDVVRSVHLAMDEENMLGPGVVTMLRGKQKLQPAHGKAAGHVGPE